MSDDEKEYGDYDESRHRECTDCGSSGPFDHEHDVCNDCVREAVGVN